MRCAIGIDVGGTKCAAGLVSLDDGRVVARCLRPTKAERGGEAVLVDVLEMARSLQADANQLNFRPESIGIGLCELVGVEGQIHSDATIHWMGTPVAGRIEHETRLPVFIDADVRAAARAEAHFGAGRNLRCFLYVTVGTGISSCLVVDRKPFAGARGLTGTFASGKALIASTDGELLSGPPLEQFSSGPALASRFATVRVGFAGAAPEVLALAEAGDPLAGPIVESAGKTLGAAIAQLVNVLDPEAVVIGGGLGLATGRYRHCVESALREYVWSELHRNIRLVSATLGNDAGIVGAALWTGNNASSPRHGEPPAATCPPPKGVGY
jgi:glucokinase